MKRMEPLQGKVVLVTGAARRIGRAIALHLGRAGATVAVHYGASEAEARTVAQECGGEALQANLASVLEIQGLFEQVRHRFGRLDGLVNNAARFTQFDPMDITEADWDYIHSVNLKAVFFCCQHGAKIMRGNGGGRIVNISSLGGIRPWAENVHYCASKAGVIHLTRALAKAFAPEISVNSVAPGVIPFEEAGDPDIQRFVRNTPMQRAGTGEEIAEAVAWFLSASRFVTGQILTVDGGLGQR
jgi:NAD(P)-dependent dehydrogenase (short-subunit alcohol dehydrogenase family)